MLSLASSTCARHFRSAIAVKPLSFGCSSQTVRGMGSIAEGVDFDTIAREWRCKWSADNDKASLEQAQKVLTEYLDVIKGTAGVKSVHRIVCGGNLDFKIITAVSADEFKSWADIGFPPEAAFLDKLSTIDGIHTVETQTYTFMEV